MARKKKVEEQVEVKVLDVNSDEYWNATLKQLVFDARARKDKGAVKWLDDISQKTEKRTRNNKTFDVKVGINSIRKQYAELYKEFKPKPKPTTEEAKQKKRDKAEEERRRMFEEAYADFDE